MSNVLQYNYTGEEIERTIKSMYDCAKKYVGEKDGPTVQVRLRDDWLVLSFRDRVTFVTLEKAVRFYRSLELPTLTRGLMKKAMEGKVFGFEPPSYDRYHVLLCIYEQYMDLCRSAKILGVAIDKLRAADGLPTDGTDEHTGEQLARAVAALKELLDLRMTSRKFADADKPEEVKIDG